MDESGKRLLQNLARRNFARQTRTDRALAQPKRVRENQPDLLPQRFPNAGAYELLWQAFTPGNRFLYCHLQRQEGALHSRRCQALQHAKPSTVRCLVPCRRGTYERRHSTSISNPRPRKDGEMSETIGVLSGFHRTFVGVLFTSCISRACLRER